MIGQIWSDILAAFQSGDTIARIEIIVLLLGFPSLLLTVYGVTRTRARRGFERSLREMADVEEENGRLRETVEKLRREEGQLHRRLEELMREGPQGYMHEVRAAERDDNVYKIANLAHAFVDGQSAALAHAFAALRDEAILHAAEGDGAAGYENAILYARAGLATGGDDTDLQELIAQLRAAAALEAAGTRTKLKPLGRNARSANDLPTTLKGLRLAHDKAFSRGQYRLTLLLAQKALGLTSGPSHSGSDERLFWRYRKATALLFSGRPRDALDDANALLPDMMRVMGEEHPNTLATQHLVAQCKQKLGRYQDALDDANALLPNEMRIIGEEHPDTLATQHLIVQCKQDLGRYQDALDDANALLPDMMRIMGEEHPYTLTTRRLIAQCKQDLERHQDALDDANALLPDMMRIMGEEHPHTLTTRYLIALCRLELGDLAFAEAERDAIRASAAAQGVPDETRLGKRLARLDEAIAAAKG